MTTTRPQMTPPRDIFPESAMAAQQATIVRNKISEFTEEILSGGGKAPGRPTMKPPGKAPGKAPGRPTMKPPDSGDNKATPPEALPSRTDALTEDFVGVFEEVLSFAKRQRIPHGMSVDAFAIFLREVFLKHTNKPDFYVSAKKRWEGVPVWKTSAAPNTLATRVASDKFCRFRHPNKLKQRMYTQATFAAESAEMLAVLGGVFLSFICEHGLEGKLTLGGQSVEKVVIVSRKTQVEASKVPLVMWNDSCTVPLIRVDQPHSGVCVRVGGKWRLIEFAYEQFSGKDTGGMVVFDLNEEPPEKATMNPMLLMTQFWAETAAHDEKTAGVGGLPRLKAMTAGIMERIDQHQKNCRKKKANKRRKQRKMRKKNEANGS